MQPLFTHGSPVQQRAFRELRDQLQNLGFYAERPRPADRTLRAYPETRHSYPLFTIEYCVPTETETGGSRKKAVLVVTVLSKGLPGIATKLLRFPSTTQCWFEHTGALLPRGYRRHGRFIIPVDRAGKVPKVPTDALRKSRNCTAGLPL